MADFCPHLSWRDVNQLILSLVSIKNVTLVAIYPKQREILARVISSTNQCATMRSSRSFSLIRFGKTCNKMIYVNCGVKNYVKEDHRSDIRTVCRLSLRNYKSCVYNSTAMIFLHIIQKSTKSTRDPSLPSPF